MDPLQVADCHPALTGFSPTPLLVLLLPEAVSSDPPSTLMFLLCTLGMFPLVSIVHFKLETEKNYFSPRGGERFAKSLSCHFFFMSRNWEDLELFFCRSGISVPFPPFPCESWNCDPGTNSCQAPATPLCQQGTVRGRMLHSTIWTRRTFCLCADSDLPVWPQSYLLPEMLSSSKWTQWWVDSGILPLQIADSSGFSCCLLTRLLL